MDFRQIIQRRMEARGWTPYRLAQEAGVTNPTIYNLLSGKPVKSDTLSAVFKALQLEVIVAEEVHDYPIKRSKRKEAK